MSYNHNICPHCGCRCEDDEYCAACGKLFHEDQVSTRDVSVFGMLKNSIRSSKLRKMDQEEMFKEDLWDDPSLDFLPGNLFNKN